MRYIPIILILACAGDEKIDDSSTSEEAVDDTAVEEIEDTGDVPPVGPQSDIVDDECLDGQYSEVLPTPTSDISSWLQSYSSSDVYSFIDGILTARFPTGQFLFEGGYNSQGNFSDNCLNYFLYDNSSASAVIGQLSTIVHECGHFFDLGSGGWGDNAYLFTEELNYTCSNGSTPDNGGGQTFSRSLINNDEYASLHPPCANFTDQGCDSYAAIYLNGDPNDGTFDSGDQGYGMLHEETLQYIHSLATSYSFADQYQYSTSARDGILTFLWYTMRYLRMARLEYPQTYTLLSQDACWREMILTTWGRAWLYLELTQDNAQLGINDDFLETLVRDETLLSEIERLRELEGCN